MEITAERPIGHRNRMLEALLRVALWSVLLGVITHTRTDPDLWGHVRFGLDVLRDASIPHVDPYSFTSDREWINHEWAAEAISGGVFQIAGSAGLVLLKIALIVPALLLLHVSLRLDGMHARTARDVMAGLAVITTMEQAHHVRPQLFSLLFFTVLLWCVTNGTRGNHRWLALLPALFAGWANLHGGWIVGGAVLILWTIGLAARGALRLAAWCALAGAVSLAATLVTPYGFELWQFLLETVGLARADIADWQPIYALGPQTWVVWGATLALVVLALLHAGWTNIPPERLMVVGALALASLRVNRLLAFFALATLLLLGGTIAEALKARRASRSSRGNTAAPGFAAACICVTAAAVVTIGVNVGRIHIDSRTTPEPEAIEFLSARADGRVLVWFDWGQYAIWHLPSGMRVSIDGRRETVYSAGLHDRHLRFYFDLPGGAALPRELAVDYVWIPRFLPAARRLGTSEGWARVYASEQSVIFQRADAERLDSPVVQVAAAGPRRFPGP